MTDFLPKEAVIPALEGRGKIEVITELCSILASLYPEVEKETLVKVILERERLGSTGIGKGVAIPHGKIQGLSRIIVSFGRSREGVDFEAVDGNPAHFFFLILVPHNSAGFHLKVLAAVANMMNSEKVRQSLMGAEDREEIYSIIEEAERGLP